MTEPAQVAYAPPLGYSVADLCLCGESVPTKSAASCAAAN